MLNLSLSGCQNFKRFNGNELATVFVVVFSTKVWIKYLILTMWTGQSCFRLFRVLHNVEQMVDAIEPSFFRIYLWHFLSFCFYARRNIGIAMQFHTSLSWHLWWFSGSVCDLFCRDLFCGQKRVWYYRYGYRSFRYVMLFPIT